MKLPLVGLVLVLAAFPCLGDLSVSPGLVTVTLYQGQEIDQESVLVSNPGGGQMPIPFTVQAGAGWLDVYPESGTCGGDSDAYVYFDFLTQQLPPGTYSGIVTFSSTAVNNPPVDVTVMITILPATAVIGYAPPAIHVYATQGDTTASDRAFQVWNAGADQAVTNMEYYLLEDDTAPWFGLSAEGGTSAGEKNLHFLSLRNLHLLSEGSHTGRVFIETEELAVNDPQELPVYLTIQPPPARLELSASTVNVGSTQGVNAASQFLFVHNAGGGTMDYRTESTVDWMQATPAEGTVLLQFDQVTLDFDTAPLAPGTYRGSLLVTAPDLSSDPRVVSVTLTVMAHDYVIRAAYAGGPPVPLSSGTVTQQVSVWNESGNPMGYRFDTGGDSWWISVVPSGGTASAAAVEHDLVFDATYLLEGSNTSELEILAWNAVNMPYPVPVTLNVASSLDATPSAFERRVKEGETPGSDTLYVWNSVFSMVSFDLVAYGDWLHVNPTNGFSGGADTNSFTLSYDTTDLSPGLYEGLAKVRGIFQEIDVPVRLTVESPFGTFEEKIVYSTDRDGDFDIWCVDPGGSRPRALVAEPGDQTAPRISPDGTLLAYLDASVSPAMIVVRDLESGEETRLREGVAPQWLADSSGLVASLGEGRKEDLVLLDLDTNSLRPLYESDRQRVMGVHRWTGEIFYISDPRARGGSKIRAYDPATALRRDLLAADGMVELRGDISPEGVFLCYEKHLPDASRIYLLPTSGGTETRVSAEIGEDDRWPCFAPDEDTIAFVRTQGNGDQDLYLTEVDGGEWRILEGQAGETMEDVDWGLMLSADPVLRVSPHSLYQAMDGTSSTLGTNSFQVWNAGDGTLRYQVTSDGTWLSPRPHFGLSTGEHDFVTVLFSANSLPTGSQHTATLTVSANGANEDVVIPVTMDVLSGPPEINTSAGFTTRCPTGTAAYSFAMPLWNTGGSDLVYTVDVSEAWMHVSTPTGYTGGEVDNVMIEFISIGLGLGSRTGVVAISSSAGTTEIPVVFEVTEPNLGDPEPALSPSALSTAVARYKNAGDQAFHVVNPGGKRFDYYLAESEDWLRLAPTSDPGDQRLIFGGSSNRVDVIFDTAELQEGAYTAEVLLVASTLVRTETQELDVVVQVLPPDEYTLDVIPQAGGTVAVSPATGPYAHGTEVTLAASNAYHYSFIQWHGLSSSDPVATLVMDEDKSVWARFERRTELAGFVTNYVTGEPVEGARVAAGGEEAITDRLGAYHALFPPCDQSILTVNHPSYRYILDQNLDLTCGTLNRRDFGLGPDVIRDVKAIQRPGTRLVDITFDVMGDFDDTTTVGLEVSADGGTTWDIPVTDVSGAYGTGVPMQPKRRMTWNAGTDYNYHVNTNMRVGVVALGTAGLSEPFELDTTFATSVRFVVWAEQDGDPGYSPGEEVEGAQFYFRARSASALLGTTDRDGVFEYTGEARQGDEIFARKTIRARSAVHGDHGIVDGHMYRLWLDSDMGGGGDQSDWDAKWRSRKMGQYDVQRAQRGETVLVRLEHPLFEWNLVVAYPGSPSTNWLTGEVTHPAANFLDRAPVGMWKASRYLYRVTYGQMKLGKVWFRPYTPGNGIGGADVRIELGNVTPPRAWMDGIYESEDDFWGYTHPRILMGEDTYGRHADHMDWARALIHEFGHYALGLYDEYEDATFGQARFTEIRERNNYQDYPENYGLMDSHFSAQQLSSFNDYLEDYDEIAYIVTDDEQYVTEQIFEENLDWSDNFYPCWRFLEKRFERWYQGYDVEIVVPKRGYFKDGQSTTEDRASSSHIPNPYVVCEMGIAGQGWIESGGPFTTAVADEPPTVQVLYMSQPIAGATVAVRLPTDPGRLCRLGVTGTDGHIHTGALVPGARVEVFWKGAKVVQALGPGHGDDDVVIDITETVNKGEKLPDATETWPLGPNRLGLLISGGLAHGEFTLQLDSSLPLAGVPTVLLHPLENPTSQVTMVQLSPTRYQGTIVLSNAPASEVEISCTASNGLTFESVDSYGVFPVTSNSVLQQLEVEPSPVARRLETIGLLYRAYGPVPVPQGHAWPTNQVGPALFVALQDAEVTVSNAMKAAMAYADSDVAGLDETGLGLYHWNDPPGVWAPRDSFRSPAAHLVSATLTNDGVYVLLADTSADGTPPAGILDLVATMGSGPLLVHLEWTAPGDDGTTGTATVYEIRFSLDPIRDEAGWSSATPHAAQVTPGPAGSAESVNLTMGLPGTLYYFAVRARDEAGNLGALSTPEVAVRSPIKDTDGDGLMDQHEFSINLGRSSDMGLHEDVDRDGLNTWEEKERDTDPNAWDTDGDGMGDGYEDEHGLDPLEAGDGALDSDGDGLTNLREHDLRTDPFSADTDGDGMDDGWEEEKGLDPTTVSRENGATDNPDLDVHNNLQEYIADTDPLDGASYLRLDGVAASNAHPGVEFWSSSRRIYDVDAASNLVGAVWQPLTSSFYGLDQDTRVEDPGGAENRTYRLRVRKP